LGVRFGISAAATLHVQLMQGTADDRRRTHRRQKTSARQFVITKSNWAPVQYWPTHRTLATLYQIASHTRGLLLQGWLGSRVVSVLDSSAVGPVHQAVKLVATLLRVAGGNCGPGGKQWQPTAGFMTHVTCRPTAKNRDQHRNPTLGNRVWATFTFF